MILLSILPLSVCAQQAGGNAERGEKLYYDFACHACHGYNATMRVPLIGDASAIMGSEKLYLSYLRLRGDQNPVNPKNSMPNYDAETLSDAQALDIYAYIKSVKDDPAELDDDSVMQQILEAAKARNKSVNEQPEERETGESK